MFDLNVACGHWPFRRTPATDAASLEALLRAEGITGASAYPLEAYFYRDPQEANELRLPELAASPFFAPSAVINPALPSLVKSYERCRRLWSVQLVRIMPGYHLYDLAHPGVDALATRMASDEVALGIHIRAEDERAQSPIARIAPVPFDSVISLCRRHPTLPVVAFSAYRVEILEAAPLPDNLYVDLSFFEHEASLSSALNLIRSDRLVLGTHAPLFYPRACILKVQRSEASPEAKRAVAGDNAVRVLGKGTNRIGQ